MKINTSRLLWIVLLAFILTILPLPIWLASIWPPWVLLLILILQFFFIDYFNIFILLIFGFMLDLLLSTVIGEHIFVLALVSWLASTKIRRFYFFNMGQQMCFIGSFCLLYQFIISLIDSFLGYPIDLVHVISSACISLLLWPWLIKWLLPIKYY